MSTLTKASHQWASRPADERFLSLSEMHKHFMKVRQQSRASVIASNALRVVPSSARGDETYGMVAQTPDEKNLQLTNWSFGQLAALAEAPAGYMRSLPAPIAADCVNFGLQFKRGVSDVGVLVQENGDAILRAATGPRYGRIWNADVVSELTRKFGDGDGHWRVPGEFGQRVKVTKANTTLYASDRDMFVFLADEDRRIEMPNRRNGQPGSLARGFFVWNSEVGKCTMGIAAFLFDYVCCNRIVWGAEQYQEITIRHTSGAPGRWLEEVVPALEVYAQASSKGIEDAIAAARRDKLGGGTKETRENNVSDFLAGRFGKRLVDPLKLVHQVEEGRPIESRWDAVVAATAYARQLDHVDARVDLERSAGQLLDLAA